MKQTSTTSKPRRPTRGKGNTRVRVPSYRRMVSAIVATVLTAPDPDESIGTLLHMIGLVLYEQGYSRAGIRKGFERLVKV